MRASPWRCKTRRQGGAQMITTIGFDADDTLWQNEAYFRLTQDRFADLLRSMNVLERVSPLTDEARSRMERALEDPEARLDFALDWLELVILGASPALAPKAD